MNREETSLKAGAIADGTAIEVPKIVSDAQTQFFVDNGYLVVPELLSLDEIEELRQDAATLARGGYPCDSIQPLPDTVSDEEQSAASSASISRTSSVQ